jgi:hypothetical protein
LYPDTKLHDQIQNFITSYKMSYLVTKLHNQSQNFIPSYKTSHPVTNPNSVHTYLHLQLVGEVLAVGVGKVEGGDPAGPGVVVLKAPRRRAGTKLSDNQSPQHLN